MKFEVRYGFYEQRTPDWKARRARRVEWPRTNGLLRTVIIVCFDTPRDIFLASQGQCIL